MELSGLLMILGFLLAAYSVVANDVIQTLGTFLSSNEKRPWWFLFLFAGSIMLAVLAYGYYFNHGDVTFGRLDKIPYPEQFEWYFLLPPIVLLFITRYGIPVSTTFLVLSIFSSGKTISGMAIKSGVGYLVSFAAAFIIYMAISKTVESRFQPPYSVRIKKPDVNPIWVVLQWFSTGFLWSQWLMHDLANIFVYLPRRPSEGLFWLGLISLLVLLAVIFYTKGGKIQRIVKTKNNTHDIRSATVIDLIYGIILYVFKEWNNLPMSTTWVFVGLLAGREYGMRLMLDGRVKKVFHRIVAYDFLKILIGLVISLLIVVIVKGVDVLFE